ncbi:MAG: thioredoxin family protein [Alphaproteobacteria bacterium]|nr:thioredoxin family protein [Alphaproteobacteria bacterium]
MNNVSGQLVLKDGYTNFWQKKKGTESRFVIKGKFPPALFFEDTTTIFWFHEIYDTSTINQTLLNLLIKNKNLNWIIFIGTWCDDTRAIIPGFIKHIQTAKIPENKLQYIGVDRFIKTTFDYKKKYHITNVPTFIIFKDNQEIGRIIEYGEADDFNTSLINLLESFKN